MTGRIVGAVKTPWHLWALGALATLWNAGGMFSWYTIMLGDPAAMGFTAKQVEYLTGYPVWALIAYTMGTWGAFFGSVALLLRRKLAVILFAIAVLGLAGTTIYERVISTLPASMQGTGQMIFTIVIWATTLGLFLYSRTLADKRVLR
ncbi:MAG: hypothetical protein AAFY47_03540 [Pseudomonadota bacterium]